MSDQMQGTLVVSGPLTKLKSKFELAKELYDANPKIRPIQIQEALKCNTSYAYDLLRRCKGKLGYAQKKKLRDAAWAKKLKRMQKKPITFVPVAPKPAADLVNHPPHYTQGGIETIDFIEAKKLNYNLGNVVKYITRADHKGSRLQDLEKAQWYLSREIASLK
jgi:hypothetical protein